MPSTQKKIAIVCCDNFTNKQKIKQLLIELKFKYTNPIIVGVGGNYIGNIQVKKFTLMMGLDYVECTPAYEVHNLYSITPESYHGKSRLLTEFWHYEKLIKFSDEIYIFNTISKNTKFKLFKFMKLILKFNKFDTCFFR